MDSLTLLQWSDSTFEELIIRYISERWNVLLISVAWWQFCCELRSFSVCTLKREELIGYQ